MEHITEIKTASKHDSDM